MLISSSLGAGASPCMTQATSVHFRLDCKLLLVSTVNDVQHSSTIYACVVHSLPIFTHLELLWKVKGNCVVLLGRLEVSAGLDKRDDWSRHTDLGVVNIVARYVSEQFLHIVERDLQTASTRCHSQEVEKRQAVVKLTVNALVIAASKLEPSMVVPTNLAAKTKTVSVFSYCMHASRPATCTHRA